MSEKQDFLTFSGGIGNERWARMGESLNLRRWYAYAGKMWRTKMLETWEFYAQLENKKTLLQSLKNKQNIKIYCPISLLLVCSMVFKRIINNNLSKHLLVNSFSQSSLEWYLLTRAWTNSFQSFKKYLFW